MAVDYLLLSSQHIAYPTVSGTLIYANRLGRLYPFLTFNNLLLLLLCQYACILVLSQSIVLLCKILAHCFLGVTKTCQGNRLVRAEAATGFFFQIFFSRNLSIRLESLINVGPSSLLDLTFWNSQFTATGILSWGGCLVLLNVLCRAFLLYSSVEPISDLNHLRTPFDSFGGLLNLDCCLQIAGDLQSISLLQFPVTSISVFLNSC